MFYIGLDLGQRQDHSAVAIVERPDLHLPWITTRPSTLLVRRAERLALGTPYPRVVERVREIVRGIAQSMAQCTIVVDATGVDATGVDATGVDATGVDAPVVELLRSARLGCGVTAVTIMGGEKESGSGAAWNVPKRDPIAGVQLALEKGDLRIARHMKEAGALVRELVDVRFTAGLGTGRAGVRDGERTGLAGED